MGINQHNSEWTNEIEKRLVELRNSGMTFDEVTQHLNQEFNFKVPRTVARVKAKYYRVKDKNFDVPTIDPVDKYGVKKKRDTNTGEIEIDRLIEIKDIENKDDDYIIKAHGYDPTKWDLVNHEFSMWNHHNKQDGTKTLYASKVRIKPKENGFDWDKFLEIIKEVPKVTIKPKVIETQSKYLLLPLFDMHFGVSNYEHYIPTQAKILQKLKNNYKEVALIFGQDAFHNDDFHGRTTKGTQIQKVDMIQAWKDAVLFFEPIIKKALEQNSKVKIYYSKGNHSETIEWAFVQYLKARFPQCEYDDTLKERKVVMLGKNFIGMNHGDKKNEKRLPENFATEFPVEWSKATTRTVFTGHRHSELVEDAGGILVRRMPTRNITDDWHDDMGYTTQHKRFQIHEFDEKEQTAIYYV